MKRLVILLIVTIGLNSCDNHKISAPSGDRASQLREQLLSREQNSVFVVAHRGDWRYAPENSLPAIENAIEMGVDIIELDIQCTKDGHLILMHDATLDRTTTGKGKVSEWTLDSVKMLKLRNGCHIRTKEVIPTLEEALLLVKDKVLVNLDKADRYFDKVYALLETTGTTHQIIMKGSKPAHKVKEQFGQYLDKVIYMPIVKLDEEQAMTQIEEHLSLLNPVAFELLYTDDTNPLPKQLAAQLKGKTLIWYNTLWDTMAGGHDDDLSLEDPDKGYGYLVNELGARIIQTDRPAYLIDYLKEKGWHQ
jgi:glycerophosphoryl diester phosphodiesterase